MILTTQFDIGQQVVINEIDLVATVVGFRVEDVRIIYKVEYWLNGEIKIVDQWENQLRSYTPKGR